ncbi:multidrug resistance efflux transporter family protein [Desulfovibrio sp. OttesenSCG-928-M14]|nr:multidrug resistance efflux transporter family protein [Desulfovibrio sp. OttesenSCG-928-M14]
MRAILYGLTASLFFASTFILNRAMELGGGHWAWSASLRFFFMLPLLLALVAVRSGLYTALAHLWARQRDYFVWSTTGFGLFYAPICFAAAYGEGWLLAGTWQITIIAGPLLSPFLLGPASEDGKSLSGRLGRIPFRAMRWSLLILVGIALMQLQHARAISASQALYCILPILLAAFAYPLGNRKMMEICKDEIDTFQRVLNMTIASLPFWIVLALYAFVVHGPPTANQAWQSFLVALFAGIVATLLFFAATNLVKRDPARLAAVEATQAGELLFAFVGEIVFLAAPLPSVLSMAGMALVVLGMLLHSLRSNT